MGRIDGREERPYVMVDRELIELLEPDELALYVVLLSYLRSPERMADRELWPSEQEIGRVYGRSHDVVRRVMKKLIDRGLVTKTRRGKTESNRYRLAAAMPGAPASDAADSRNHSGGDDADPRTHDAAKTRSHDDADPRNEVEEPEGEEGKDKNDPVGTIASLSPTVPRKPAQAERDQIFIQLAHEHGVSADRLAAVAREHGATPEEFAGAWRMANGTAPGADEYDRGDDEGNGFRKFLGAWIKAASEVAQDLANYRDKLRYDARQAEYAVRGTCAFHWQPYPCTGCAADSKAVADV